MMDDGWTNDGFMDGWMDGWRVGGWLMDPQDGKRMQTDRLSVFHFIENLHRGLQKTMNWSSASETIQM